MPIFLDPLHIPTMTLPNRLVMPPMATLKASPDGKVTQALLDYYHEKTKSKLISLVIVEHSYVNALGKADNGQLSIADDSVIEPLSQLVQVLHNNGAKAVLQISHAGSAASPNVIGTTPVAPSPVINPRHGTVTPRELTLDEIEDIIVDFREAAWRAYKAGFDGVEIHSAHGYLLNQFLSPLTNQRNDKYGGDIHGRIKIHLKIIKAIRSLIGKDFTILLRLAVSDYLKGGITPEECQTAAKELEKAELNILDVSGGFCGYTPPGKKQQGYFAYLSEAMKDIVNIPVILTGGISDVNVAETLLSQGKADLIGVGRALLNDSLWPEKAVKTLQQK